MNRASSLEVAEEEPAAAAAVSERGRPNKETYSSSYKLLPAAKLSSLIGFDRRRRRRVAGETTTRRSHRSANLTSVILNRLGLGGGASERVQLEAGLPAANQAACLARQRRQNQCLNLQTRPPSIPRRSRRRGRRLKLEVNRTGCEYISMISGRMSRLNSASRLLSHDKVKKANRRGGKSEIGGCRRRSLPVGPQAASAGPQNARFRLLLVLLLICFSCFQTSEGTSTESPSLASKAKYRTANWTSGEEMAEDESSLLLKTGQGIFRGLLLEAPPGDKLTAFNKQTNDWRPTQTTAQVNYLDRPDVDGPRPLPVAAFLGIRYASAPIKRLRFMPPTAYHYGPNQVHEARKFAAICPQQWPLPLTRTAKQAGGAEEQLVRLMARLLPRNSFAYLGPLMSQLIGFEQSEDCLNLNIYTTLEAISGKVIGGGRKYRELVGQLNERSALLPVLVIIHGDSFDYGSGNTINGFNFVKRNKLVVVTLNYRLNILGFPPRLAGASRGNLGLMDQVAALHWIRDNIESFGGSPNNITLVGSKRAAIFVNLLMMSPLAKDLFQRAVMEDGSALTPLVANHIQAPSGQPNQLLQVANLQTIQHVRLLAKLCDCPLRYSTPQQTTPTAAAKSQLTNNNSSSSGSFQFTSGAEETRANALMFECLRDRPVEQIVQFQANALIHFNQLTGELSVPGKFWAKYLLLLASQQEPGASQPPLPAANPEVVTLEARDINGLMARLSSLALMANESNNNLLFELLDAIHLNKHKPFSASSSLYPLFGPTVDGTIVPDEDMALSMLKGAGSATFGQRHLLIGLSKPLLIQPEVNQTDPLSSFSELNYPSQLPSEHLLADQITLQMEREGLSNEQAVEFISLFVRSFYRFHNQEITNSIISQYLNSLAIGRAKQRRRQEAHNSRKGVPEGEEESEDSKAREQQLLILDTLLEAFKDALVSVPVLKTALIHATKQLEPLIEPFIGQQFERWRREQNHNKLIGSTNNIQILESFITFAQSLYADKNWPLELQNSQGQLPFNNPKATYLYQFDSQFVLKQIHSTLAKLDRQIASSGSGADTANIWIAIRLQVSELLAKLQTGSQLSRLGIGCALDSSISQQEDQLLRNLLSWVCDKFSSTLAAFALTGNVNKLPKGAETDYGGNIFDEIQQFSTNTFCSRQVASMSSREMTFQDHHSVNLSSFPGETPAPMSDRPEVDCYERVLSLTFRFLTTELSGSRDNEFQDTDHSWKVFDVFSQQLASIPGDLRQAQRWRPNELIGNDNLAQDSTILSRSSFWSNFIPALNCSRTQPINPLSLLGGSHFSNSPAAASTRSLLNSTLMNINLVFTCQSGLAFKTVHDIIDSMVVKMTNELQMRMERWLVVNNKPSLLENHHSLRMANLNQSNSMMAELENLESQQSGFKQDSYANNSSTLLESLELSNNSNFQLAHDQQVNLVNKIGSLTNDEKLRYGALLACGLLVSITIASSLFKRRKRSRELTSKGLQSNQKVEVVEEKSEEEQANSQQIEFKQLFVNEHQHNYQPEQNVTANGGLIGFNGNHQVIEEQNDINRQPKTSYVYAIETGNEPSQQTVPVAYWTAATGSKPEEPITLCRSHSTLSMSNGSTIVENLHKLAAAQNKTTGSNQLEANQQEQLIMSMMMPPPPPEVDHINLNRNRHESRFGSCLLLSNGSSQSGNGHYGGSSGDTQNPSSLSSSQTTTFNNNNLNGTIKKRVKIRDPPESLDQGTGSRQKQRASKQLYSNGNLNSSHRDQLYCPVHRPINGQDEQEGSPEVNMLTTGLNQDYYLGELSFEYSPNIDPSFGWSETGQLVEGAYGGQIVIPAQSGQPQQQLPSGQMIGSNGQLTNHQQMMIHYHRHPHQQQ